MRTSPIRNAALAALAALGLGTLSATARAQSDQCAAAAAVPVGTYTGTTAGATNDGSAGCGSAAASPDVWYRFTAPQNGILHLNTCGSAYDTVLSVHSACPGTTANQLACSDDTGGACGQGSTVTVAATGGVSYLVRVSGFSGAAGAYTLAVTFELAAGSDACADATPVTDGSYTGSTLVYTNDGSAGCGVSATSPDAWFRYTPTDTCPLRIDTCGSAFDTVISVHTGGCPGTGLTQIACNDDNGGLGPCPGGTTSLLTVPVSAGTPYLIRLAGYNGSVGAFAMNLSLQCGSPGPDACAAALEITPGTYTFSTSAATVDGSSTCDGAAPPGPDVWLRYTPAETSTVRINTCSTGLDTILSVHTGCPGTVANQIAGGCNNDACGVASSLSFAAAAATPYFIRVAGSAGARGTFTLVMRSDVGNGGADAYVGELGSMVQLGRVGDTVGCAIDTPLCNVGVTPLDTMANPDARHPFFVFNLYRLRGDRFEQIGQSWAKHMQGAAQGNACGFGCVAYPNGSHLGVGCSDTYGAAYNGTQSILGPRGEINPWTGAFTYAGSHFTDPSPPPTTPISYRLQLRDADLDPALNPGAVYFAEQYTVAHDDGNHMNSVARERAAIGGAGGEGGTWTFDLSPRTSVNGPAIASWPGATLTVIPPGVTPAPDGSAADGRCILGVKVTDNGDGTWHYEYALYNHDMDRAARGFTVPVGAGTLVRNIGFSAPRSHDDGPAYHNNPWPAVRRGASLAWTTDPFGAPIGSNPVRWGTLYNFRFDADRPPVPSRATLELYKPAPVGSTVAGPTLAPAACTPDINADGIVDVQDFLAFLQIYAAANPRSDLNADGVVNVQDFLAFLSLYAAGCA